MAVFMVAFVLASSGLGLSLCPAGRLTAAALSTIKEHCSVVGIHVHDAARETDFVSDLAFKQDELRLANHGGAPAGIDRDVASGFS